MKYLGYNLVIITLSLTIFGCSTAEKSGSSSPVSVTTRLVQQEIIVEVKNINRTPIELENADVSSVIPGDPGIIFNLKDHSGRIVKMCAMVEPAYPPDLLIRKLGPSEIATTKIEIRSLARRFCVKSGKYEFWVVFSQAEYQAVSNATVFSIP